MVKELIRRQPNVLDDLSEDDRREVARPMVRHRCLSPVWMAKLPMRPALAHLDEAKPFKDTHGFPWFKNRQGSHSELHHDSLRADKLGFHLWLSILQQHLNHLAEVFA